MRLRLMFLVLIVLAAPRASKASQDPRLTTIVVRYGGEQKLAETEFRFKAGRRCGVLPPCQDFRYYRRGSTDTRVDESFSARIWTVRIISEHSAEEFYIGPWWKRAWYWATGMRDGRPLDRLDVSSARLDTQQFVFDFLRRSKNSVVSYEGKSTTVDGRSADAFSQALPERKAIVRYFFDAETHLCLQRTITDVAGERSGYIVYSDYREVNGLPYPFRAQIMAGKTRVQDETVQLVQIGVQLDDRLFTTRPNEPLWVFPLKIAGVAAIVVVAVWVWRRRRAKPNSLSAAQD